jgi:hypothetical protein
VTYPEVRDRLRHRLREAQRLGLRVLALKVTPDEYWRLTEYCYFPPGHGAMFQDTKLRLK